MQLSSKPEVDQCVTVVENGVEVAKVCNCRGKRRWGLLKCATVVEVGA